MSTPILVNLPDEALRRAQRPADLTRRDVADVVADMVVLNLPDLPVDSPQVVLNDALNDEQILALAQSELPDDEDALPSHLLDAQQSGELSRDQQRQLVQLMRSYQELLLLKAEAPALAVERGLIPPLAA